MHKKTTMSLNQTANTNNTEKVDIFNVYNSNCLKGVAIIMLLVHHCFLSPKRYSGQQLHFILPEPILNYIALFFKICVCIFVFISAYGITKKVMPLSDNKTCSLHHEIKNIMLSRLIKLLGSFIFVFLLVDLFALFYDSERFAEIYGASMKEGIQYYIIDMLGLAELLQTPTFLGTYWYYSLAIILILLTPLLYLLLKRIGSVPFLSLMAVINFTIEFQNRNIWHYFLCIGVGIVCASENIITRLVNLELSSAKFSRMIKFLLEIILLFILMVLREGPLKGELYPLWDAIIPVVLTCFCCEFIFIIPGLQQVLLLLGKYSVNIFLVHNYIRNVWFYDYTYHFKYPFLIVIVLLLESLVLSIFIEWLKKIIHYDRFISILINKINGLSCS